MRKKFGKRTIILAVAIFIMATAFLFLKIYFSPERRIETHMEAANRYLLQAEYDKAIEECNAVIEIDPMNAMGYIKIACISADKAERLVILGDITSAYEVLREAQADLENGYSITQNGGIERKVREITQRMEKMQNPDFLGMTRDLAHITEQWRYLYDTQDAEIRQKVLIDNAEQFQKYITLYESVYGTEECTCGALHLESGDILNDNKYFDLGIAYDYAIFFRLASGDEDTAWKLRCAQTEKSGTLCYLDGFSTRYEGEEPKGSSGDVSVWIAPEGKYSYYDKYGNSCSASREFISAHCNGIQTYDGFGRVVLLQYQRNADKSVSVLYHYENGIERKPDKIVIDDVNYSVINDITSESSVSMNNLLISFVMPRRNEWEYYSELHDNDYILYVFQDGSVYSAVEYIDDYYECFSERSYHSNTDDMWTRLEDWVFLGMLPTDDLESLKSSIDAVDENQELAGYHYSYDPRHMQFDGNNTTCSLKLIGSTPSWDATRLSEFEKLKDIITDGFETASLSIYKNSVEYKIWDVEDWKEGSLSMNLSNDEDAMDVVSYLSESDLYKNWRELRYVTGQEAYGIPADNLSAHTEKQGDVVDIIFR